MMGGRSIRLRGKHNGGECHGETRYAWNPIINILDITVLKEKEHNKPITTIIIVVILNKLM